MYMGQLQYAPKALYPLTLRNTVVKPLNTAGEVVYSTTIKCVHEQSLTGICIFPVLYLLPIDHLYKLLTKTKNTQTLKHVKY